MISPTVGRKVWFRPNGAQKHIAFNMFPPAQGESEQPLDATVVYVHSDRMVNLVVLDHMGEMHKLQSVLLLQDVDLPSPGQMYAEWMPYQTGQAKRT